MFKNKTLLLIIGLIILLLIIMAVQFAIEKEKPAPSSSPTPTAAFDPAKIVFELKKTSLTAAEINLATPIILTFSKPVNKTALSYVISPETPNSIPLSISYDSTESDLTINPRRTWDFDTTYTLTIKKTTKSKDGASLKEDIVIDFKTASGQHYGE